MKIILYLLSMVQVGKVYLFNEPSLLYTDYLLVSLSNELWADTMLTFNFLIDLV
jgi:hypothetical protein